MARFIYTKQQLRFLELEWKKRDLSSLTKAFNARFRVRKSRSSIKAALKNHGFKCGRPVGSPTGNYRLLSKKEAAVLARIYQDHTMKEAVKLFNRECRRRITLQQAKSFVHNNGINCGRTGCFEKGIQPWNTGTKGVMKPNSGTFKQGQTPGNTRPMGSERIDTKDGYVLVKVAEKNPHTPAPTRFKAKHIVVWEKAHGRPVPKGYCVRFQDGDKRNFAIENLVLMTRGANALLNKKYKLEQVPSHLKKTMILIASVEAAAGSRRKRTEALAA